MTLRAPLDEAVRHFTGCPGKRPLSLRTPCGSSISQPDIEARLVEFHQRSGGGWSPPDRAPERPFNAFPTTRPFSAGGKNEAMPQPSDAAQSCTVVRVFTYIITILHAAEATPPARPHRDDVPAIDAGLWGGRGGGTSTEILAGRGDAQLIWQEAHIVMESSERLVHGRDSHLTPY